MFGGLVSKYGFGPAAYHLRRGEIYNIGGKTFWTFGGADSIDKANRIVGQSWWARESPSHEEYAHGLETLDDEEWKVDIVLTHTMPKSCVSEYELKHGMAWLKANDPVTAYLDTVAEDLKFDRWFRGHFHCDERFGIVECLYETIVEIT